MWSALSSKFNVWEGRTVGASNGTASQDAQGWHDCHCDQLRHSHFSVREGRAVGAGLHGVSVVVVFKPLRGSAQILCGKIISAVVIFVIVIVVSIIIFVFVNIVIASGAAIVVVIVVVITIVEP